MGQDMSRAPNTAAREYISRSEQSVLEEYGITSAEFNQVREDREPSNGSRMVKDDQPLPDLKPSKEMAHDTDRDAFNQKWADEMQRAQQEVPEQNNSRDLDREYSR